MSRGNRNLIGTTGLVAFVAVVIGFLTWPRQPKLERYSYESPESEQYRPGGTQCEPKAVAAIRNGAERLRAADACSEKAEAYRHDRNDLIQQARAANAAEAQAQIASQGLWTAWFQTIGGFITLAAAIAAAIYAREAAKEGKRSADEAERSRHSSTEGERGHIKFVYVSVSTEARRLKIIFNLVNNGNSMTEVNGLAVEFTDEPIWPTISHPIMEGLQVKIPADNVGEITHTASIPITFPATASGFIRYSTLTLPDCRTYFCFSIIAQDTGLGGPQFRMGEIPFAQLPHDT